MPSSSSLSARQGGSMYYKTGFMNMTLATLQNSRRCPTRDIAGAQMVHFVLVVHNDSGAKDVGDEDLGNGDGGRTEEMSVVVMMME